MDTLIGIIEKTIRDKERIKSEHEIYRNFQARNPWHVEDLIRQIKSSGNSNISEENLTFEKITSLKPDYLLDNYSKVYKQIRSRNPEFKANKEEVILYYTIIEGLFKKQLSEGYELGDKDKLGNYVNGSNITLVTTTINIDSFLKLYFTTHN